jgi:hypothetical protein
MANFLKRWYTGLKTATTTPTLLETHVQDTTIGVQERLALEHQPFTNGVLDTSLATAGGRHVPGKCSVCSYGTTAPSSPTAGSLWYDTTTSTFKVYNGSTWLTTGAVPAGVPSGTICMWVGNYHAPPAGWSIFTAANRRFIYIGEPGYYPATSIGSDAGPSLPAHNHQNNTSACAPGAATVATSRFTTSVTLTVPYYSVYLIKKD